MKRIFSFLRFFLAFFILFILIYKLGFKSLISTLLNANPLYLFYVLILWTVLFILGTFNLNLLLNALNFKISSIKLFKYYLLSWSSGLFLPGKVGEFILVHLFKKEKIPVGQGLVITLLDKLITLFVLLIFALMGFFFLFKTLGLFNYLIIFLFLLLVFLFFILTKMGRKFIVKYILKKYSKVFKGFSRTISYLFKHKKLILLEDFIITLVKSLIAAFATLLLFLAFNQPINLFYIIIIDSMVTIISFVPLTPNGLGLKESSAVILYSFLGINPIIAASAYILGTILTNLVGFTIFLSIKLEDYF